MHKMVYLLSVMLLLPLAGCAQSTSLRKDVFVSGTDSYHTYRIPALIAMPTGTLLVFCEGRRNNHEDTGDVDLLLKRSNDGGRTWSSAQVVQGQGGDSNITIGNPCPILDTANNATSNVNLS